MDNSYVKLQTKDLGSKIRQNISIFEEFCDIHLKVDRYIGRILSHVRKLETTCLDRKLLKYYASLQYNQNQIKEWRKATDVDKEDLSKILSYWYYSSLYQCKKIVGRLKKIKDYIDVYTKVSNYVDRMKIIVNNPRYLFV